MDTVLGAFVAIFITLFAALSLTSSIMTSQEMLRQASLTMQSRLDARARTILVPISGRISNSGTVAEVVYRNEGQVKLADFDEWDVIIEYTDDTTSGGYHLGWMPYTSSVLLNNQWAVSGIYVNAAQSLPEAYERGILNPGEEIKFSVKLSPSVGHGKTVQLTISTPNGVSGPTQVTRNFMPVLAINTAISVPNGHTLTIDKTMLEATDVNNTPDQLTFTVTMPPALGTLSPGLTFTQADINNGLLTYTRTSTGADSFMFSVSDGEDTTAPQTFIVNP